jgi:sugar phosphate isomerase/epimerase
MPITTSFITANFVGRALNYNGPLDWAPNDEATVKSITPDGFLDVVRDVVAHGFDAVDIWTAHCHWKHHDREDYLEQVKGYCSQFDLTITSYAGGVDPASAADIDAPLRFMKQLGAPMFAGGIWGPLTPAEFAPMIETACQKYGVRWALENHPEKSVDEIFARIDNARHAHLGVALDTGWCATQGLDALDAVKHIQDANKLFILHLKDVTEQGKHDTCAIGEGIAPCEQIVRHLARSGWQGNITIEHEPYDRDPLPEIDRSLARVKEWLKG